MSNTTYVGNLFDKMRINIDTVSPDGDIVSLSRIYDFLRTKWRNRDYINLDNPNLYFRSYAQPFFTVRRMEELDELKGDVIINDKLFTIKDGRVVAKEIIAEEMDHIFDEDINKMTALELTKYLDMLSSLIEGKKSGHDYDVYLKLLQKYDEASKLYDKLSDFKMSTDDYDIPVLLDYANDVLTTKLTSRSYKNGDDTTSKFSFVRLSTLLRMRDEIIILQSRLQELEDKSYLCKVSARKLSLVIEDIEYRFMEDLFCIQKFLLLSDPRIVSMEDVHKKYMSYYDVAIKTFTDDDDMYPMLVKQHLKVSKILEYKNAKNELRHIAKKVMKSVYREYMSKMDELDRWYAQFKEPTTDHAQYMYDKTVQFKDDAYDAIVEYTPFFGYEEHDKYGNGLFTRLNTNIRIYDRLRQTVDIRLIDQVKTKLNEMINDSFRLCFRSYNQSADVTKLTLALRTDGDAVQEHIDRLLVQSRELRKLSPYLSFLSSDISLVDRYYSAQHYMSEIIRHYNTIIKEDLNG